MSKTPALLKCLVKAILRNMGKVVGMVGTMNGVEIPGADIPGSLVADAWENWDKQKQLKDKLAELESYARLRMDEHLANIKKEMDEQNVPNGELREAFEQWLSTLPEQIKKNWRRSADPSGTTVPANAQLNDWKDLQIFLPPTLPRFRPGDSPINGYRLERPLGSGGFGEVWLAKGKLGVVALKFLLQRPTGYGSTPKTDALDREADVHKRLTEAGVKKGILRPRDYRTENGLPCLVYDYIKEGDLTDYIRAMHSSALTPAQIEDRSHRIVHQIASTMAPAHAAGIIHRDLKPANVLVDDATLGKEEVLVGDWGTGQLSADQSLNGTRTTATAKQLTQSWSGSYTPNYASPNQKKGGPSMPQDDVHALGVIWYQLLTGQVEDELPPDWREILAKKGVQGVFVQALGRCLSSTNRFPNAAALVAELDNCYESTSEDFHRTRQEREERQRQLAKAARQAEEQIIEKKRMDVKRQKDYADYKRELRRWNTIHFFWKVCYRIEQFRYLIALLIMWIISYALYAIYLQPVLSMPVEPETGTLPQTELRKATGMICSYIPIAPILWFLLGWFIGKIADKLTPTLPYSSERPEPPIGS